MNGHRDLKVYQLAYALAMEIFNLSKNFPKEEVYSLTDQIRRSSRGVVVNIAEGYRKRQYPKMFVNSFRILTAKLRRRRYGSILRVTVNTSRRRTIAGSFPSTRKSDGCSAV